MGFLELLTLIFIVLKLTGVIAWSWWLVLTPLIIAGVLYSAYFALIIASYIHTAKAMRDLDGK